MDRESKKSSRLPKVVVSLGITSFLTDVSSEMILPVLPIFITTVLGGSKVSLGLIEGVAESTSSLLKIASGWVSDVAGKRKPFLVFGYAFSNLMKPLLAVAQTWPQVLGIRFADRIGKGIRTSPRDAMIADATRGEFQGKSFGFHRAMDTMGAVVGTLITFLILSVKKDAMRMVFALSLVPGLLACLNLIFTVREKKAESLPPAAAERKPNSPAPAGLIVLTSIMVVFTFATPSYAFLMVRASDIGISARFLPLVYLLYNIVYAALAMPVGISSDKLGRENVLIVGLVLNALLCLGFVLAFHPAHIWLLFILYGFVSAVTETVPRALVSDKTTGGKRGTGFGIYHTAIGLAALPSAVLFGFLWERFGPSVPFVAAMVFSSVATFLLIVTRGGRTAAEKA
ncbi:MAG: MFS transporter [Candidatus Eisenbacteria bacterium]|nr:MFS transporter [Candidatus Eisenbacteria bacterium]